MRSVKSLTSTLLGLLLLGGTVLAQEGSGSVRGVVLDQDFGAPLPLARVLIVETGQTATTTDQGNFVFREVEAGQYTLVFSKEGYVRQVRADVLVTAGQLTDVNASLSGDFTEMEEFVVQDILQLAPGSEASLLKLRFESPALMDSISAELMARAGASDAASALRLVSGATVQDGKFAVIRGLPDRYVSSQMNGVRLPTADEDKRAVELDQFPSSVIESVQVTKTFTPDQQGDASGGAVDVRLKGIPDQTVFQVKGQIGYNTNVAGRSDFLTYEGGGVNFWGRDDGGRDIQFDRIGQPWEGAVGVTTGNAPVDYKWSTALGGKRLLDNGVKVGAFASFFYERDSSYIEDGQDNSYWVETTGGPMVPQTIQGTSQEGTFKTRLFDITQGSQSVQWGGLGTVGLETENHALNLTFLYTHDATDKATLAIDTRGKEFFFPGYDPTRRRGPGNLEDEREAAPYIRTETLEYTERTTSTVQLSGRHVLPFEVFTERRPELTWTAANSFALFDQPDKRQFGAYWLAPGWRPPRGGRPGRNLPQNWLPFKPAENFTLGNVQRIWKSIEEDSQQYSLGLNMPFEQWNGREGYLKLGLFDDRVDREFDQNTYSNFNDTGAANGFSAPFSTPWSSVWNSQPGHEVTGGPPFVDVDYLGQQNIHAVFAMADVPVTETVNLIGGVRFESTQIGIQNIPEEDAQWFPPGFDSPTRLNPGDADVDFSQQDILPSIGLQIRPNDLFTIRGGFSQTVARQTFKELTPIIQQEFLGGPIFIGSPSLGMSRLNNYDLRVDYTPYPGGLLSASYFDKSIEDPIEYIQRVTSIVSFTTPTNFPKGKLRGVELEARQNLDRFTDRLQGMQAGANVTFIDSEVDLPEDQKTIFENLGVPISSRDMLNAPEYLLNLFLTYDVPVTNTQLGVFYTVKGDTLVEGAGESIANFVPSVYATRFDTLNVSLVQRLGPFLRLQLQGKNLTNPRIDTVYRSQYIDGDVLKTSFTAGVEFSASLALEIVL